MPPKKAAAKTAPKSPKRSASKVTPKKPARKNAPKPAAKASKPAAKAPPPKAAPAKAAPPKAAPAKAAPPKAAPAKALPKPAAPVAPAAPAKVAKAAPKPVIEAPKVAAPPRDLATLLGSAPYDPNAAGVGRAKGLGVSRGVEALLGLGFPHLIVTTADPLVPLADRAALEKTYPRADAVMPRAAVDLHYAVASRVLAGDLGPALPKPEKPKLQKAVTHALTNRTGWTVQELEVFFGTLPVLEEIVTQLGEVKSTQWGTMRGLGPVLLAGVAWMLWRVPTADRDRLRAALRAKLDTLWPNAMYPAAKILDVILRGRAGIERSGRTLTGEIHLGKLVFADDDPDWVYTSTVAILEKLRPQDRELFDPQLIVLCPRLLPVFRKNVDKFPADQRARMEARLALFA